MIENKKSYLEYLKADQLANGKANKKLKIWHILGFGESLWVFLRILRLLEYIKNCKKGIIWKIYYKFVYYIFTKHSMKLGFSIPINVLGKGISLPHRGTIVINSKAKIGDFCKIHVCTNIGGSNGGAPLIGNSVYIAPGAKIFGDIKIADGIAIGANSVVHKSFEESNISIGGIPSKKISEKGSKGLVPNNA